MIEKANIVSKSVDVWETKNMSLFNKVHNFEPKKRYINEPNISLINLISLMFNYAKLRIYDFYIWGRQL